MRFQNWWIFSSTIWWEFPFPAELWDWKPSNQQEIEQSSQLRTVSMPLLQLKKCSAELCESWGFPATCKAACGNRLCSIHSLWRKPTTELIHAFLWVTGKTHDAHNALEHFSYTVVWRNYNIQCRIGMEVKWVLYVFHFKGFPAP